MAAPAFGALTNGTPGVATSASASAHASRSVGDLLTAFLYVASTSVSVTATGWTLVNATAASSVFQILTYQRIADGTSADDFRGSWTGSLYSHARNAYWTGGSSARPIDVAGIDNNGSSSAPLSRGATTTVNDTRVIAVASYSAAVITAAPSGMTLHTADDNGSYVASVAQAVAGASGDKTWTGSRSDIWAAHLFAITPAPAAAPARRRLLLLGVG